MLFLTNRRFGVAVAAALVLALTPVKTALAVDPCFAKKAYDQHYADALKQKQDANRLAEKLKPKGDRLPTSVAELKKMIQSARAQPDFIGEGEKYKTLWKKMFKLRMESRVAYVLNLRYFAWASS